MTDQQAHILLVLAAEVQGRDRLLASYLTSAALGDRWRLDRPDEAGVRFDRLRFAIEKLRAQLTGDPTRREALDAVLASYSANGVPLGRRREPGIRRTRIDDRAAGHPPLPGPCVTTADFMFARPDQWGEQPLRLPWLLGSRSAPIRRVITKSRGVAALHAVVAAHGEPISGVPFLKPGASYVRQALRPMLDLSRREVATVLPDLADALTVHINQHGDLRYTGTATFDTNEPAGDFSEQRSAHVPTSQRNVKSWGGAYGFEGGGRGARGSLMPGRIMPITRLDGTQAGLDDLDRDEDES